MITDAKFTNADHSVIQANFDGKLLCVPVSSSNRHYLEIVESGIQIAAYVEPPLTRENMVVSRRQAFRAMAQAGVLATVQAAVDAQGGTIKIDFDTATDFKRLDEAVLAMQPVLGWTDEQLDDLFVLAKSIPQ